VIHIAVRNHAVSVLKELRRFMPDLTLKNHDGLTAIELAHQINDEDAANALLAPFSQ
jgi:ankyrin repeat protein